MPVKYGFIGTGAIAQRRHIPECAANPDSKVAALADPSPGRAETLAKQYGAKAYTDHKEMLKSADIDAVVVAGPNSLHAAQSLDALNAGKHVLCEKPMATTREDARAMMDLAKKIQQKHQKGVEVGVFPKQSELADPALVDEGSTITSTPIDRVYEHGFYPLQGGFRAHVKDDFEIFDQWLEILPTDQVVPVEVRYDPKTGRQV